MRSPRRRCSSRHLGTPRSRRRIHRSAREPVSLVDRRRSPMKRSNVNHAIAALAVFGMLAHRAAAATMTTARGRETARFERSANPTTVCSTTTRRGRAARDPRRRRGSRRRDVAGEASPTQPRRRLAPTTADVGGSGRSAEPRDAHRRGTDGRGRADVNAPTPRAGCSAPSDHRRRPTRARTTRSRTTATATSSPPPTTRCRRSRSTSTPVRTRSPAAGSTRARCHPANRCDPRSTSMRSSTTTTPRGAGSS